ncbi:MAG: TRAP transporter small permease subunit [Microcystaceae cyanobacterium]
MQQLLRIATMIDTLNEWVGRLTYWLVLAMVGVGVINVFLGKLGQIIQQQLTSNTLLEIQWHLFDLVFLFGAAYTLKHNEHVRVDIFYKDLSAKYKALINFIGSILFLIPFSGMLFYFSIVFVTNSWKINEKSINPGGIPPSPIKTMILVCFALLILQGISEAIKNWAIFSGHLTLEEEQHDAGV